MIEGRRVHQVERATRGADPRIPGAEYEAG